MTRLLQILKDLGKALQGEVKFSLSVWRIMVLVIAFYFLCNVWVFVFWGILATYLIVLLTKHWPQNGQKEVTTADRAGDDDE
jgi:hypothetical protein